MTLGGAPTPVVVVMHRFIFCALFLVMTRFSFASHLFSQVALIFTSDALWEMFIYTYIYPSNAPWSSFRSSCFLSWLFVLARSLSSLLLFSLHLVLVLITWRLTNSSSLALIDCFAIASWLCHCYLSFECLTFVVSFFFLFAPWLFQYTPLFESNCFKCLISSRVRNLLYELSLARLISVRNINKVWW